MPFFYLDIFNYLEYHENKTIQDEKEKKAFSLFISASEQKHLLANFYVGECYHYGRGVEKMKN